MRTSGFKRWSSSSILFLAAASQSVAARWSFTGSLEQARLYAIGTVLPNGEVLVVGGSYRGTFVQYGLTSAELYNPSTGTSSFAGSLNTWRYSHTATLLNNGTVLIVGGLNNNTRLSSRSYTIPPPDASPSPAVSTACAREPRSRCSTTGWFCSRGGMTAPSTFRVPRSTTPLRERSPSSREA
jgi:Galactose oxidase, central domain